MCDSQNCNHSQTSEHHGLIVNNATQEIEAFTNPDYLESRDNLDRVVKGYDKPDNSRYPKLNRNTSETFSKCLNGWVSGKCDGGHTWAKAIYCDKEYCDDCGKKDSHVHERRVARWYDKVMEMDSMGYMVITIPESMRKYFLNNDLTCDCAKTHEALDKLGLDYEKCRHRTIGQKRLSFFRRFVIRKLKRMGFDRGLTRWHWAGDCKECVGAGCDHCRGTGGSRKWSPHLNVFIDAAYIDPAILDGLKSSVGRYLSRQIGDKIGPTVIHYQYSANTNKKMHLLKYVTRATWRFGHLQRITRAVFNAPTTNTFGKFKASGETSTNELAQLEASKCPCCKSAIDWEGFQSLKQAMYQSFYTKKHEGGYYRVNLPPDPDPPPELPEKHPFRLITRDEMEYNSYVNKTNTLDHV